MRGALGNAEEDHQRRCIASATIAAAAKRKKKATGGGGANKVELDGEDEDKDKDNNRNNIITSGSSNRVVAFLEEEGRFPVSPFPHPRSRSQAATRRVTPTPAVPVVVVDKENAAAAGAHGSGGGKAVVEKALPNGDLYSGSFSGSVPHGVGKYLWADGCMYEGEWRRGKAAGKGKFSWPSGATFEGEFRSGRMEGFGTFTGSDGDTYRGLWVADRKQGHGQKRYANGDYYEGGWRRNLQEGQGRYVWRNGNQYVGEWRNGVISGRGVLIWANGNRYDGQWENGVPAGGGVFTWPDGSCYVVSSWLPSAKGENPKSHHIHGTFYPSTTATTVSVPVIPLLPQGRSNPFPAALQSPPFTLADSGDRYQMIPSRKRSSVDGAPGRGSHADKNFPRICIWESDGEAGDITCDIIDTVEASMLYRDGIDKVVAAVEADAGWQQPQRRSPWCFIGSEPKKQGQAISKGHKNYDLMRNLQLGISYSVGKPASSSEMRELRPTDFDPREKFWTRFPPEGSKVTPPHQSIEFRWKDYCPMVFRHLRKLFAVDPADYMLAICGNEALRELSSPGKSGSFFYLTQDDRFMIKTVKKSEVKVLIRMLPSYYAHVSQHRNTLVTKFFGVHCVKPVGGQKVRFIVMGNLFCSEYRIHRRFDLKGSSYGRTAEKAEGEIDETTTLKDLDLNFVFRLKHSWFQDLLRQIDRDCEFLEAERIMDYSLLVGLHFCDDILASRMGASVLSSGGIHESHSHVAETGARDMDGILDGRKPVIRLGANMPARAELVSRRSESEAHISCGGMLTMPGQSGEVYEVILYFGIIDILQDYDISKKLEHAYKSLQVDPTSISAVDPKLYSKRFRDFIRRIFVEDRR